LVQEAKQNNIKATEDEIETLIGSSIIEDGITLEEFDEQLKAKGVTIEDVKKSFDTRVMIMKLLERENINTEAETIIGDNDAEFQVYLDDLLEKANIEIILGNLNKLILKSFEDTGDEICGDEMPIVRLYTTSWCEVCKETVKLYQDLAIDLLIQGNVLARHWSLDTGNNLLTVKVEEGVPKGEVEIFRKYSPDEQVPAMVLACKYKRIGSFGDEDVEEFKNIIKEIAGE